MKGRVGGFSGDKAGFIPLLMVCVGAGIHGRERVSCRVSFRDGTKGVLLRDRNMQEMQASVSEQSRPHPRLTIQLLSCWHRTTHLACVEPSHNALVFEGSMA